MFEFTTWLAIFPDFFVSLRHYTVIGKQLLLSNDRNRVRGAVLGLSQDGASTNSFENFRENSETYRMIPLPARLFFHWSIPLIYSLALGSGSTTLVNRWYLNKRLPRSRSMTLVSHLQVQMNYREQGV
jgi:hypothetical protein